MGRENKKMSSYSEKGACKKWLLAAVVPAIAGIAAFGLQPGVPAAGQCISVERPAKIRPDYCGIVIPPNIAPLNFLIEEPGARHLVRISAESAAAEPIDVVGKSGKIVIPEKPWRELLNRNKGRELRFDVFVQESNGQWQQFQTFVNRIAEEQIDPYLVYRKIRPAHNIITDMGIYQRSIEGYKEELILHNRSFGSGCGSCHTFCGNNPDNMLIQIRTLNGPRTLLIHDGKASSVDSRTPFAGKGMGHAAWHPSGKVIAFAIYDVRLFYHTARQEVRDALDRDSALGYYLVDAKTVKTCPKLSSTEYLETWPAWSPDGRYLYFCRAPKRWSSTETDLAKYYKDIKCDLVRISYDIDRDEWGELETVLSAGQTGKSIVLPRISPDGRWLLFCMCDYSAWAGFQSSSDLYIADLKAAEQTGRFEYHRLEINSDQADYWKSWSNNSRWIVFSSKRDDGIFTKPYFSYVDSNGLAHKPFVLPQKDPAFYDSSMKVYQLPELVKEPIPVTGDGLAKLIRSQGQSLTRMPLTSASPRAQQPLEPATTRE